MIIDINIMDKTSLQAQSIDTIIANITDPGFLGIPLPRPLWEKVVEKLRLPQRDPEITHVYYRLDISELPPDRIASLFRDEGDVEEFLAESFAVGSEETPEYLRAKEYAEKLVSIEGDTDNGGITVDAIANVKELITGAYHEGEKFYNVAGEDVHDMINPKIREVVRTFEPGILVRAGENLMALNLLGEIVDVEANNLPVPKVYFYDGYKAIMYVSYVY